MERDPEHPLARAIQTLSEQLHQRLIDSAVPPSPEQLAALLWLHLSPLEAQLRVAEGAAQVAHELRNPLAVISTSAEIIAHKSADPAVLKHSTRITKQAQVAAALTAELLSAASAMSALSVTEVPLWPCVIESIEQAQQRVILHADYTNSTQFRVSIDERRTQQVIANLLMNAAQAATKSGHTEARVKLDVSATETTVALRIQDHSGGMSETQAANLFVDRHSTQATFAKNKHGIGLPLARRLARLQGGDLTLQSTSSEGSVFVLTMKRAGANT